MRETKHNRAGTKHTAVARAKSGKRFNAIDAFRLFCIWMKCGRDVAETARLSGVSYNSVRTLVNDGRKNIGINPFAEIAEKIGDVARNVLFPEPIEEFIEALWEQDWAEERVVRTVMLILHVVQRTTAETFCKHADPNEPMKVLGMASRTLDVLKQCCELETEYMKRARKLGLKFGDGTGGQVEDLSKLSTEQLRKRVIEARAVEEKK